MFNRSNNIIFFLIIKISLIALISNSYGNEGFNTWLNTFKSDALKKGISQETIKIAFKNVKYLDQVIKSFDGILIARGDLGVEMQLSKLPIIQKNIIGISVVKFYLHMKID